MTPKLLSPEELTDVKANPLHVHLYDAWLIVNTIAALEADNAALLKVIIEAGEALRHKRKPDALFVAISMLSGRGHPGATLLSEHAKALVRARNEGRVAGIKESMQVCKEEGHAHLMPCLADLLDEETEG